MNERKLSRGVIFEAREHATIFGNYLERNIEVIPHLGTTISTEDIDVAVGELYTIDFQCSEQQALDMIAEGCPNGD